MAGAAGSPVSGATTTDVLLVGEAEGERVDAGLEGDPVAVAGVSPEPEHAAALNATITATASPILPRDCGQLAPTPLRPAAPGSPGWLEGPSERLERDRGPRGVVVDSVLGSE